MSLGCGSCSLCCTLLKVTDISKPAGMTCWWTTVHGGCQRHAEKTSAPELAACGQWKCLWLESQNHPDPTRRQDRAARPDMIHVVMGPRDPNDQTLLYVHVDPRFPNAWKEPRISEYLAEIVERGVKLHISIGERQVEVGN